PDLCFLAQGLICLGPATRSGCGERCINANMPCRGCFGPVGNVVDHGAKILSSIASILGMENEEAVTEEEVDILLDGIVDPGGLFYMYSLPSSLLKRKKSD
ncbi:oxidoreductase, partial [Candidatus Calescamantes bacterium]|nr:oxidoreductase [Candidatus Calescamantes bacterium]